MGNQLNEKIQPDLAEAQRFFDLLCGANEFPSKATVQTFDDRKQDDSLKGILHGSLPQLSAELIRRNQRGAGIFVALNETDGRGRKNENITSVRALFLDLDGAPLPDPTEWGPTPPHVIVETSPDRFHCLWLVNDCPLDKFKIYQKALAERFNGDPSVSTLERCVRVPGFFHNKSAPFQSHIVKINETEPYKLASIGGGLQLVPKPTKKQAQPNLPVSHDGPLVPAGQRHEFLLKQAARLRNTGLSGEGLEAALRSVYQQRCEQSPHMADSEIKDLATHFDSKKSAAEAEASWVGLPFKEDATLAYVIKQMQEFYRESRVTADYSAIARSAFAWFKNNGARFFKTPNGDPFMSFRQRTYWLNSSSRLQRGLLESMLFQEAGLMQLERIGKAISEGLRHLCLTYGDRLQELSWCHTDLEQHTVYFALNDEQQQIVKISPDTISTMPNGDNPAGVLLSESPKIQPIVFNPDVDPVQGWKRIAEHFLAPLACAPQDRFIVFLWLAAFLLADFVSTRPTLRIEGPHGQGKTFLSKLLSVLVFGQDYHQKFTVAAAFADAERSPIQCIDNFEADAASPEFLEYLLLATTGAVKEMRTPGTDAATVVLRPRALIQTNGIDPIGSGLGEVLRRTFTIPFGREFMQQEGFIETTCVAHLRKYRDEIFSYLFGITQRALALMRHGGLGQVKKLLDKALKGHSKAGCNDYLAVMYLINLVAQTKELPPLPISEIHPTFLDWIRNQDTASRCVGADGNQIATALAALFSKGRFAAEDGDAQRALFRERYHVEVQPAWKIPQATSKDLFIATSTVARDCNLRWDIKSAAQLGARMTSDERSILEAGFLVTKTAGRSRKSFYTVEQIPGESPDGGEDPKEGFTTPFTTANAALAGAN